MIFFKTGFSILEPWKNVVAALEVFEKALSFVLTYVWTLSKANTNDLKVLNTGH